MPSTPTEKEKPGLPRDVAGRVFGRALELFDGDTKAARRWLSNPQPVLGGGRLLEHAENEVGAREVEAAIGRIEHGVVS